MTTSRFDHIASVAGADDWYDPWGEAMSLFFSVAEVLDASDVEGDLTPGPFARWEYNRSVWTTVPSIEEVAASADDFNEGEWPGDYTYAQVMLATALYCGELSQDDLVYAGDVLDRYTRLLKLAGKDY